MVQRIELLGVDDRTPTDVVDATSVGASTSVTVGRVGFGGTRRWVAAAVALLVVGALVIGSKSSDAGLDQRLPPVGRQTAAPSAPPDVVPPPAHAGWRAPPVEPVASEAAGVTLLVGRGVEKTFIELATGKRSVVDVAGVPVAGAAGFVLLSDVALDGVGDDIAGRCWFSIVTRVCQDEMPSSIRHSVVALFDETEVRSLAAVSSDGRWFAEWQAGQLVVIDRRTGELAVVPDLRRSYFDDALVLVG